MAFKTLVTAVLLEDFLPGGLNFCFLLLNLFQKGIISKTVKRILMKLSENIHTLKFS
jgi:hypothetical protein